MKFENEMKFEGEITELTTDVNPFAVAGYSHNKYRYTARVGESVVEIESYVVVHNGQWLSAEQVIERLRALEVQNDVG